MKISRRKRSCRQLRLYYTVHLTDEHTPREGVFCSMKSMQFHWLPLERLHEIELYPTCAAALLTRCVQGVSHFIEKEN